MTERWLYSVLEKKKKSKKLSWTGSAAQCRKAKGDLLLGGAGYDSKRGQREKGKDGKRREAKYLLPCLSESKRCRKVESGGRRKTERERERGKVGEERRASYCYSSAGKQGNEMVRKQFALRTCGESFKSKK